MAIQAGGRNIDVRGIALDDDQTQRLQRTLMLLPPSHLRALTHIAIRDRNVRERDSAGQVTERTFAGGSTNSPTRRWSELDPGLRQFWVMLDIDSFSPIHRSINCQAGGYHYTLLHEMGHVVDWSFSAFSWIRTNDRAGYDVIARRSHTGITHGDQERFADVYADLMFYRVSQRATTAAMQAVMASPPFQNLGPPFQRRP